jgi:hypothetical protein
VNRLGMPLALALLLAAPTAAEDEAKKPPTTVRWHAPLHWSRLKPQQGEFAAWLLRDKKATKHKRKPVRLTLYRLDNAKSPKTLEARLTSWARRFLGPDSKRLTSKAAKAKSLKVKGLKADLAWLEGSYFAPSTPGEEARPPRRGWAGVYARVLGPDGEWIAAMVGPRAQVGAWRKTITAFIAAATPGRALRKPDPREQEGKGKKAPSPYPEGEADPEAEKKEKKR